MLHESSSGRKVGTSFRFGPHSNLCPSTLYRPDPEEGRISASSRSRILVLLVPQNTKTVQLYPSPWPSLRQRRFQSQGSQSHVCSTNCLYTTLGTAAM